MLGAADFKELIPEFYSGSFDFLLNNGVRIQILSYLSQVFVYIMNFLIIDILYISYIIK